MERVERDDYKIRGAGLPLSLVLLDSNSQMLDDDMPLQCRL
jgi:hypothetical protein